MSLLARFNYRFSFNFYFYLKRNETKQNKEGASLLIILIAFAGLRRVHERLPVSTPTLTTNLIMLPNLVPPSRDIGEDPMSTQLREQFRAFQQLHSQHHHQDTSAPSSKTSSTAEDTDDETLPEDFHIRASSSSFDCDSSNHNHMHDMAISTAIAAQNEIDSLMNGIAEFERAISSRTLTSASVNDNHNHNLDHIGASSRDQGGARGHTSSSSSHLTVSPVED